MITFTEQEKVAIKVALFRDSQCSGIIYNSICKKVESLPKIESGVNAAAPNVDPIRNLCEIIINYLPSAADEARKILKQL